MKKSKTNMVVVCAMLLASVSVQAFSQTYLGDYTSYSAYGNRVTIHAGAAGLRLIFYKPNVVRIDFMADSAAAFPRSLVIVPDSSQPVNVSVTENDSTIVAATSSIRVVCGKFPLRLNVYDANDEQVLGQPAACGFATDGAGRLVSFAIRPGESFYGTGERGVSLDLRGLAFDSYNEQHGGYPSGGIPSTMNVNIPFVISSDHYGLYFEDTYEGHYDIGHSNSDILTYTADDGELSCYLICNPTYTGILSDYTWLTGRAPLLPIWAYGYIQSKFGYRDYQDAEQTIQTFRVDTIPCDAIVLDLYWFNRMGDLAWNTSSWPNPNSITSQFLSQGFKTVVITEPYITAGSLNFATADQGGYFAKDSSGSSYIMNNWWSCGCDAGLLDITDSAAQSWWWGKYRQIFQTGVSGLWTDLGEPERDYSDMKFKMGSDAEVHNIYDFLWAKTIFDGFSRDFPNERMFNLTRSGYAGIQRFGTVTWSGDVAKTFAGLSVQLPLLLNMGMSGITYHNSDIGGFTGNLPTTPELYTRWMEFGAFCPVMRAHGYDGLGGTEPWAFNATSPSTEGIVRNIIRLRYSLLPYNYTMAHIAYETGVPIARPLLYEYPDDPNLANESAAYMWGDDMLVAPVVQQGQTSVTFYLPAGRWIDYWNDRVFTGGGAVTLPAPIDEIPILVKAGSIVPMQQAVQNADQYPADTITLAIYPDPPKSAAFTLYEDDGKSLDYQKGAYAQTSFEESMTAGGSGTMSISIGASVGNYTGKPAQRVYICEIHKLSHQPAGVSLHGIDLDAMATSGALNSSPAGFYFDKSTSILYVKIAASCDSSYLIQLDSVDVTGIRRSTDGPTGYELRQNFPNPFNPTTAISYQLSAVSDVTLKVYDVLGREVATLVNHREDTGEHTALFDGSKLSSGVYIYTLVAGPYRDSREMVLLK